ncbi:hypothetical protein MRX96_059289 [Rhipicephalus microplus]
MSCERIETSKQALRQESTGGERTSTTTYITTQRTPVHVQNEAQPIQEQKKSQDRDLESLNSTPGTASKTSTTTLGLIPQKNRAASAERPESPPAKNPAPIGQAPPAKMSWAAGPPNLKFS